MPYEDRIAKIFGMSEEVWARHANPWSVWTRFAVLPLLAAAVWSRVWIGGWAWAIVGALVVWTWINPRIFPEPKSTRSWASKAVFGEKVWIRRRHFEIPEHHGMIPHILSLVGMIGLIVMIYGLWELDRWATVFGIVVIYLSKMWFLDRMVWIYTEVAAVDENVRRWVY